ncbi:transcriptional regulator with XRE-family HTH domain [Microbacterium arborescens]|nr:transcriptional regulator with XRE-family HTH domain [Microbacterium arborescens]
MAESRRSEAHQLLVAAIGSSYREARLRKGWSQETVATRAGVSTPTYACLERGIALTGGTPNPTIGTLAKLNEVLGVEMRDLLD